MAECADSDSDAEFVEVRGSASSSAPAPAPRSANRVNSLSLQKTSSQHRLLGELQLSFPATDASGRFVLHKRLMGTRQNRREYVVQCRYADCGQEILITRRKLLEHENAHHAARGRKRRMTNVPLDAAFARVAKKRGGEGGLVFSTPAEVDAAENFGTVVRGAMRSGISVNSLHVFLSERSTREALQHLLVNSGPPSRTSLYNAASKEARQYLDTIAYNLPSKEYFSVSHDGTPPDYKEHALVLILQYAGGSFALELVLDDGARSAELEAKALFSALKAAHNLNFLDLNMMIGVVSDNGAAATSRQLIELTREFLGGGAEGAIALPCLAHSFDLVWKHFFRECRRASGLLTKIHKFFHGAGRLELRRRAAAAAGIPWRKLNLGGVRWGYKLRMAVALVGENGENLQFSGGCVDALTGLLDQIIAGQDPGLRKEQQEGKAKELREALADKETILEVELIATLHEFAVIVQRMQGDKGAPPADLLALEQYVNGWASTPALSSQSSPRQIDELKDCLRFPSRRAFNVMPRNERQRYAITYSNACRSGLKEFLKVCIVPTIVNTIKNAIEPRAAYKMMKAGRHLTCPDDAEFSAKIKRVFKLKIKRKEWPKEHEALIAKKNELLGALADALFCTTSKTDFLEEYALYLKKVWITEGTMGITHYSGGGAGASVPAYNTANQFVMDKNDVGRYYTVFGIGGVATTLFPRVAAIAARVATLPPTVCNNERFFSMMNFIENPRSAQTSEDGFRARALLKYNSLQAFQDNSIVFQR